VDLPVEAPTDPPIKPAPTQEPMPVPPSPDMTGFVVWISVIAGVTLVAVIALAIICTTPTHPGSSANYMELAPIGAGPYTAVDSRVHPRLRHVKHV
jgi:hypothetical protein